MITKSIYKISFENTDKVYIGQSLDAESRFTEHLYRLSAGTHHSKKLQQDFNKLNLGKITLEVIEKCSYNQVNEREIYWINKYNSYWNGYNGTCGGEGIVAFGEDNPSSKYTLDDYKAALSFLAYTDMTHNEIAEELGINSTVVKSISSQRKHLYLKDLMPKEWSIVLAKLKPYANWRTYPQVISPNGEVFTVTNARQFAREHGLHQARLCSLLNGKSKYTKGWTLSA